MSYTGRCKMKTITIRLISPIQSYGNEASFDRRTSDFLPRKSAVLGMIAASFGYHRDDDRIKDLNHLFFAVRIDQPGENITDFHMAIREKRSKNKTWLTYRDYLADAVFVVALGSNDNKLIDRIRYSLRHPKYQLYLGRKSNPPAGVLKIEEFEGETPIEVLTKLDWQASDWYKRKNKQLKYMHTEIYADANILKSEKEFLVKDAIKSLGQKNRQYSYRAVTKKYVDLKNSFYREETETSHDLMGYLWDEV